MHPIERLRFVARASGADPGLLVRETASALGAFRDDPQGLVTACRRILDRQPTSAPLWWLASRVLTAADPMPEAWAAVDELESDPTVYELGRQLPHGATVVVVDDSGSVVDALGGRSDLEVLAVDCMMPLDVGDHVFDVSPGGLGPAVAEADIVVVMARGVGPDHFVAGTGARAATSVARLSSATTWLVAGVGHLLPGRVWEALESRLHRGQEPWEADHEVVPLELIDRVVGPGGPRPVAEAQKRVDCPIAPELFKEL